MFERHFRENCYRCFKPDLMCICRDITPVATRFRLLILQHPVESRRTISTARIVSLSVTGSRLLVGVDFTNNSELARWVAPSEGPSYLVYPERGAPQVEELVEKEQGWPGLSPLFILIDGTWGQAKKIKNQNPVLASIPRVGMRPDFESNYRIRKQPRANCLSTVEATALLLSKLEGPAFSSRPLLEVFDRMVDRQLAFKSTRPGRGLRLPAPRPHSA